jgi:putative ABC transport system ATP-binding protein
LRPYRLPTELEDALGSVPVAQLDQVSRFYATDTEYITALYDVTMSVPRAALTVVSGPSGSGKSSLLRLVAGLDRPTTGTVTVNGVELTTASRRVRRRLRRSLVAYVFPQPSDNLFEYLTARAHLRLAAELKRVDLTDGGEEILRLVDLWPRRDLMPHQLSGGEQQRLAFAQALIGHPELIVTDEPTSDLDELSGSAITRLITELVGLGVGVLAATHDRQLASAAEQLLPLAEGRLAT